MVNNLLLLRTLCLGVNVRKNHYACSLYLNFPRPTICSGRPRAYPELFAVLGGQVPDLRGRVTWGDSAPGRFIEAGLPNITANWTSGTTRAASFSSSGAIYFTPDGSPESNWEHQGQRAYFDASRSSSIYGQSQTVQPPAYSVRYMIRARP